MAILSVRIEEVLQRLAVWIPKREMMVALNLVEGGVEDEGVVSGVVDVEDVGVLLDS